MTNKHTTNVTQLAISISHIEMEQRQNEQRKIGLLKKIKILIQI